MCGATSAIGLEDHERALWAEVKEPLRQSGLLTGLMRGFLGDEEVAVVIATAPAGRVRPVAVLVTASIAEELVMPVPAAPAGAGPVAAHAGEYPVQVWLGRQHRAGQPVAVEVTSWMQEHLVLYARQLWRQPRRHRG